MSEPQTAPMFSAAERATFAALLDEIIPPSSDGRFPGAGFLAGGDRLAGIIRLMPGLDLALAAGIAAADELARARGAASYAALPAGERSVVLNEVAARDGGFVPSLMFVAFTTYYVEDRVVEALALEARPPHPKGFTMGANDPTLLDPVRRRGKLYREC